MIYARELRIGNKFLGIAGVQTVFDISDNTNRNTLEYVSMEHKLMYSHLITVEENMNQYKPCEIEPIPLTPEILEKAGWAKADNSDPYGGYLFEVDETTGSKMRLRPSVGFWTWDSHCNIVHVDYVHQLQNLYYALTGTELQINLNQTEK